MIWIVASNNFDEENRFGYDFTENILARFTVLTSLFEPFAKIVTTYFELLCIYYAHFKTILHVKYSYSLSNADI